MNQTQIRYAKNQLEDVLAEKKKNLKEKFTDQGVKLTNEEKIDALRRGRFTITNPVPNGSWWYSVVDFGEIRPCFNGKDYAVEEKIILDKFRDAMDQLMLGDNDTALKLIKEFETI